VRDRARRRRGQHGKQDWEEQNWEEQNWEEQADAHAPSLLRRGIRREAINRDRDIPGNCGTCQACLAN
jgi:hypothetical protein